MKRSHRVRTPLTGIAVLAVAASAVVTPPSIAAIDQQEHPSGLTEIGSLERLPQDAVDALGSHIYPRKYLGEEHPDGRGEGASVVGTAIIIPGARQLWQVYPYWNEGFSAGRAGIVVRDLDDLASIKAVFEIEGFLKRGSNIRISGGEWAHAIDGSRRIFLAQDEGLKFWEVDLSTFEVTTHAVTAAPVASISTGSLNSGAKMGGMSYDPFSGMLWSIWSIPPAGGIATTWLYGLDPATGEAQTRMLRNCDGTLPVAGTGRTYGIQMIATEEHLFIPCQRSGSVGAVVIINRTQALQQGSGEEVVPGPISLEAALADPGGNRLFLITVLGEVWVFETTTQSFVGVIGTHNRANRTVEGGYGLDRETGRFFFQSNDLGLGMAEGRFFPIPQARTRTDRKDKGTEMILSDAATNRVFVLPGVAKPVAYTIYQSDAAPVPPPPPDPDRNTADIEEKPGVARGVYQATASGYGTRVLAVKGFSAIAPAPSVGVHAPTAMLMAQNVNSKCGFTDREMTFGRVVEAQSGSGSTKAEATAVNVDERTKVDLQNLSRCDLKASGQTFNDNPTPLPTAAPIHPFEGAWEAFPIPSDQGPGWSRRPAACTTSSGEKPKSAEEGDHGAAFGRSEVRCPAPTEGVLSAESATGVAGGGISVGRSQSRTQIGRTDRGVVSVIESAVEDVNIGDTIVIEKIRAVALSVANGRPQPEPMSQHGIEFRGVTVAGTSICEDRCDPARVLDALNLVAGTRMRFRLASGLDEALLEGSPMGAQTAAQKSQARRASDRAISGDDAITIPSLELIVYNDNNKWGQARQIYQFAGVATSVTYNIIPDIVFGTPPSGSSGTSTPTPSTAGIDTGGPLPVVGNAGVGSDSGSGGGGDGLETWEEFVELAGIEGGVPGAVNGNESLFDNFGPGRVLDAVAEGLRLFLGDPRTALLVMTGWLLLGAPVGLALRRRLLARAIVQEDYA